MATVMRNELAQIEFETVSANTDKAIDWRGGDDKMILVIVNASDTTDATLTIKKGDGIQGVADEVYNVNKESTNLIKLESGRFKNVTGTNKGKIVINSTGALSVGAVAIV